MASPGYGKRTAPGQRPRTATDFARLSRTTRPYGAVVEIPAPVGITLRTEKFEGYA
ncbi:hypothetical protein [Streptomyces sp. CNQ085]|uniref:hypothetical protein n=1 Tax=Streptomyces sp. CNQ085 TaxID=2886944 RepID=UPI001F5079D2|nr:hypothetical protein [Streptomyces sp. CNQ085]MCI0386233.1 hypothetical protein [Streptomyces sp. CNQ085]